MSASTERLGRYTLVQSEACFPLGGDTLSLAAFATVPRNGRVCDLGCGSGALGLLLLEREETLTLTGVELEPQSAALARENFERNGLDVCVITGDLRARTLLPHGEFDLVCSNPPWFRRGSGPSGGGARCEETCTLDEVCGAAGYLLKNGGRFALVHRPERLVEVFAAMRAAGLEPKRLQLLGHSPEKKAAAVLVEAVRQGHVGLDILPTRSYGDSTPK